MIVMNFEQRRQELISRLRERFSVKPNDSILLLANCELLGSPFLQESSFYYLTGCQEPGAAVSIAMDGSTTVYIPNTGGSRNRWLSDALEVGTKSANELGVQAVSHLGEPVSGYSISLMGQPAWYGALLQQLQQTVAAGGTVYTCMPSAGSRYQQQRVLLNQFTQWIPVLSEGFADISSIVAELRRIKSEQETELIYNAGQVTLLAQQAAARAIKTGITECQVQAAAEYIMTAHQARPAFDSIVASGQYSTVLHHNPTQKELRHGELVVVDIGARFNRYCADITRTYPVSGYFSDRQLAVYQIVLDLQDYLANIVKPGMYLKNANDPSNSLQHLAQEYLAEHGMAQYFTHGIGHYLGLDVHDVGDYMTPLQAGDIFTIEPGIYIPAESLGIRIEDNFWLQDDGAVCLTQELPKNPDEVEGLVREEF